VKEFMLTEEYLKIASFYLSWRGPKKETRAEEEVPPPVRENGSPEQKGGFLLLHDRTGAGAGKEGGEQDLEIRLRRGVCGGRGLSDSKTMVGVIRTKWSKQLLLGINRV